MYTRHARAVALTVVFTGAGSILAMACIKGVVHEHRDSHRFAGAPHVTAVVRSAQRNRSAYLSVSLDYRVGTIYYDADVSDPELVEQDLREGGTVDALYLADDPGQVAIAGESEHGYAITDLVGAGIGVLFTGTGVTFAVTTLRDWKRSHLGRLGFWLAADPAGGPDSAYVPPPRWG